MELLKYLEFCEKLKEKDGVWYDSNKYNKIFGKFMISDNGSVIKISDTNLKEMIKKEIVLPYNNSNRMYVYTKKPEYTILKSLYGHSKVIDTYNNYIFEKKYIRKTGENIVSSTYIESIGKDNERCVEKIISLENGTINEKQFLSSEYEQHHFGPRPCALKSFIDILPSKVHDQVHSILTEYRRSETLVFNAQNIDEFFGIVEYYDLRMQELRDEFFGN